MTRAFSSDAYTIRGRTLGWQRRTCQGSKGQIMGTGSVCSVRKAYGAEHGGNEFAGPRPAESCRWFRDARTRSAGIRRPMEILKLKAMPQHHHRRVPASGRTYRPLGDSGSEDPLLPDEGRLP